MFINGKHPYMRWKQFIRASVRGDNKQMQTMLKSSSIKPDTMIDMSDLAFRSLVTASLCVAQAFAIEWLDARSVLLIYQQSDYCKDVPNETLEGYKQAKRALKGLYLGLDRFCSDIGIKPRYLMTFCPRVGRDFDKYLDSILDNMDISADESIADTMYDRLIVMWGDNSKLISGMDATQFVHITPKCNNEMLH